MKPSHLLLFLVIGVLNPFGKKSKEGNASDGEIEEVWIGEKNEVNGDAVGVTPEIDPKKFEEMEGGLNDLKDKLKTIETGNKSIKSDLEGIRGDLKKTNETIKQLLSIYEVVSQNYNPFVETTSKKAQDVAVTQQTSPATAPAGETWPKPKASTVVRTVTVSPYDKVIGPDFEISNLRDNAKVESRPKEVDGAVTRGGDRMAMTSERDAALRADRTLQDNYYIMQLLKLIEFQLEKMYLAKMNRAPVDAEDLQNLDKWLAEFKRVGLR